MSGTTISQTDYKRRLIRRRGDSPVLWCKLPQLTSNTYIATASFLEGASVSAQVKFLPAEVQTQQSTWLREAKNRINSLCANSPQDWGLAFEQANNLLLVLDEFNLAPDRIVRSSDEGISFYFFRGKGYALIQCLSSNEIGALTKDEQSDTLDVWEVQPDPDSLQETVTKVMHFITNRLNEQAPTSFGSA